MGARVQYSGSSTVRYSGGYTVAIFGGVSPRSNASVTDSWEPLQFFGQLRRRLPRHFLSVAVPMLTITLGLRNFAQVATQSWEWRERLKTKAT